MPKTKKTSASRTAKKTVAAQAPLVASSKHEMCTSYCWIYWLFKLMIALFIIMIVFWLGFCFGTLGSLSAERSFKSPRMSYGQGRMCYQNATPGVSMKQALDNKTGDTFDKEFLLQMSIQHDSALEMAKKALSSSERPEIKKFAQSIIDTQTQQLEQMKSWLEQWFIK